MIKSAQMALAGALLLSLGSAALALDRVDSDNNPVPGAVPAPEVFGGGWPPDVRNEWVGPGTIRQFYGPRGGVEYRRVR